MVRYMVDSFGAYGYLLLGALAVGIVGVIGSVIESHFRSR